MNQLPVLDGLVLARTSKVWRDASCDVWGYARKCAASFPEFDFLSKSGTTVNADIFALAAVMTPTVAEKIAALKRAASSSYYRILRELERLAEFSSAADRLATELAEHIDAEESRALNSWRANASANILEHLESISSEVWRPVYGPAKAKYAGPVTKLTGLGWEEMRALSNARPL